MADDIKVKLGLDVGTLFADLDKVASKLNGVGNAADKTDAELKQIDNQKIDIDTAPAKQALDTLGKDAEGIGSKLKDSFSGANLGAGLVGGLAGGLASAGIGAAVQGVQALGKAIFDGAVRADEFGDQLEVAFKQQGVKDIQGEIGKVRASSLGLANDLGLPVERTRQLAATVAQLGGVTGAQAEGLTKLAAGIETFTDGTVKGEAVAKAFSRGLADPEGAAAIEALSKKYPQLAETLKSTLDPTEKLAEANRILGTSFETVKNQQSDAGGTFNKLSNSVSEAFEVIGSTLNDVLNTLIPIFSDTLGPAFEKLSSTVSEVFSRMYSVVQPILAIIGGAIVTSIVMTFNSTLVVLDVLYTLWIKAFDAIVNAFKPLIDVIKQAFGADSALSEGQDLVETFTTVLGNITEVVSEVGNIIADFGGLLIEYLITPINVVIEVIADVIRSISSWMGANDENTDSIKASSKAAEFGISPMMKLRTAFDNIRGTIGGVKEAFIAIKTVIADFFDALTQLNFSKISDILSGAGAKISAGYVKGFNDSREAIKQTQEAQKELAAITETEAQKAARLAAEKKKKEDDDKKKKPKGVKEQATALEELKEFYKDKQEAQKNDIERELLDEKNKYADKKALRTKLELEANKELRQFLNERIGGISDAETFLKESQLTVKITPSKAKGETVEDINTFYTQEIVKLRKGLDSEVKFKLLDIPAFKEELKEVDTAVKEYSATASKLVPIQFTTDSAELAKVQQDVLTFQEFLRAENVRIAQLQTDAQIAGNVEAAQRFGEAIASNIQSINGLESKVKDFALKTQEEQKKNTLEYQVQTALQTSFLDEFNSEKIRKEKLTNDAIKKERLGALDSEEKDLNKSLAKREISAEDYAAKLADINKGRQDVENETNKSALDKFKRIGDQTAASVLKSQGDIFKKNAEKMEGNEKVFNEFVGNTLNQFSVLAASGTATLADFGAAAAGAAFDAVAAMIPSFVTGILGTSVVTLGPILGPLAAASLTGVLYGLLGFARSAAGFKDGVVGLDGGGTETSDSIPAWLSRGESVITARATKNNIEELEFMNRTGLSIGELYRMNMPTSSVSVTPDGDLIREVRKLREETRGLGMRIQRNTNVEVSGVLTADSRSINAMIVQQKRREARR